MTNISSESILTICLVMYAFSDSKFICVLTKRTNLKMYEITRAIKVVFTPFPHEATNIIKYAIGGIAVTAFIKDSTKTFFLITNFEVTAPIINPKTKIIAEDKITIYSVVFPP